VVSGAFGSAGCFERSVVVVTLTARLSVAFSIVVEVGTDEEDEGSEDAASSPG
jgi:hypothetical protein